MADRRPSEMASAQLQIVVPGCPPNLGNLRLGWAARHRLVASRKALVAVLCREAVARVGMTPATSPRQVHVVVYLAGVPRDGDNLAAGLKADLDGLVAARVLLDDSPAWCQLYVRAVRVPHRREERVEYVVAPLPAPATSAERRCLACGGPLPPRPPGPGRQRRWCSTRCAGRAARRRARGLPVGLPPQPRSGRSPLGARW